MANLISESYIKPKYEVEASKQPYYLSPGDLTFLTYDQIQKGVLFSIKPETMESFLERLKKSISISLVHFYPLAGRLMTETFADDHACLIYVDCINGDGARLIHATVDITVDNILSSVDVPAVVDTFFDLGEKAVNHDGHTRPLFSIQVTELLDGIVLGFTMNHTLGDGSSFLHFISTLSEIFLQLQENPKNNNDNIAISRLPIYKPFFPDGYGPILKLPYLDSNEFITRFEPGPLRVRVFHFSSESLAKLKANANEECNSDDVGHHCISTFQALSALLWRCITRARNLEPEQETKCSLLANIRSRLKPPYSEDCFGNYVILAQSSCKVGELLSHSVGWAAMLVHQSVAATDDHTVRRFYNKYVKSPFAFQRSCSAKRSNVVIGGSARFNMYGLEFGLNRAVATLTGSASKEDGKVNAFSGCAGKGSVELEVSLKFETMHNLELDDEFKCFVSK